MKRLFIVRHGQTQWAAEKRYSGQTDIQLNAVGHGQVKALRKWFSRIDLLKAYTSDLTRAHQTAQAILCRRSVGTVTSADLREASFGEWEGLTFPEAQSGYGRAMAHWLHNPYVSSPPGGESLQQLEERVGRWLDSLLAEEVTGNLLVVTHGGPASVLLCRVLGLPAARFWQIQMSPAGVAVVEYHGQDGIICELNNALTNDYRSQTATPSQ